MTIINKKYKFLNLKLVCSLIILMIYINICFKIEFRDIDNNLTKVTNLNDPEVG